MAQRSIALLFSVFLFAAASAQVVWNGPVVSFTKPAFANPSLPASQDRITPDTWITRSTSEGLYNAATEGGYQRFTSPANTEWATGSLANYATLTYQPWATWAGGAPNIPNIVGKTAVVHLIKENIYLTITFTGWGVRPGSGGSFAYSRSTAPLVAPVKLVGFLVSKRNHLPLLQWKTASEENTASFTIERSADGQRFASIGTMPAAGNSHAEKTYSFADAAPLPVNFYRLRTTDRDGATAYSSVVAYRVSQVRSLAVFPNPVSYALHLQRATGEAAMAVILDPTGRTVLSQTLPEGTLASTLATGSLPPGLYFLVVGGEQRSVLKE